MAGPSCLKGKTGIAVVVALIVLNVALYFLSDESSVRRRVSERMETKTNKSAVLLQNKTYETPLSPWALSRNTTIVIQLSGEMGNQLSKIAFGRAVQLWAQEHFGIHNTELVFKAQSHSKWRRAMEATKACFPNMRPYDFRAGNTQEVADTLAAQAQWLGDANSSRLSSMLCMSDVCLNDSLQYLKKLLQGPPPADDFVRPDANVSMPLVLTDQFSNNALFLMDRYYEEMSKLFVFDEEACCKERPDPDESVFHFRNFKGEMPRVWNAKGFVELSPNKTATEIFGHLKPGEKVAITTRIGDEEAQKYVSALEARGLVVRIVEGQTGLQDFCFLRSTQKELVGMSMSTFAFWASYLSNATRVRLYSVDSLTRRKRFGNRTFVNHNWKNAELRTRISFEYYKTEEIEELEKNQKEES